MFTFRISIALLAALIVAWITASIIDRMRPEPQVPDYLFPKSGQVIRSRSEGFASEVIKTQGDRVWIETRLAPYALGPPAHVHRRFAENFYVAKGVLSVRMGDVVRTVREGESFLVPPGTVHRPFNSTDEEVILRGPLKEEYSLPRDFLLFLNQIYGYVDECPAHTRAPAILLQMSLFSPRYDAWLANQPIWLQRIQCMVLRPIARLLGYRSYYTRFVPA